MRGKWVILIFTLQLRTNWWIPAPQVCQLPPPCQACDQVLHPGWALPYQFPPCLTSGEKGGKLFRIHHTFWRKLWSEANGAINTRAASFSRVLLEWRGVGMTVSSGAWCDRDTRCCLGSGQWPGIEHVEQEGGMLIWITMGIEHNQPLYRWDSGAQRERAPSMSVWVRTQMATLLLWEEQSHFLQRLLL